MTLTVKNSKSKTKNINLLWANYVSRIYPCQCILNTFEYKVVQRILTLKQQLLDTIEVNQLRENMIKLKQK